MSLTIEELQEAINNDYVFNKIEQVDGSTVIIGSSEHEHLPTNTQDIEGLAALAVGFMFWAAECQQYEGSAEDFFEEFKERLEFLTVGIGGLLNPDAK